MHAFSTVQTADDNPSKPHPGMILRAMAETGSAAGADGDDRRYDIRYRDGAGGGCRRNRRRMGLSSGAEFGGGGCASGGR